MRKGKILYIAVISALCFLMIGEPVKAAEKKGQQVTAVQVPQNLNFYLDPNNEKGRGQIYSGQYKVQNSGKEAVAFHMELSLSALDPETGISFSPEEWSEAPEDRSVYMYVLFEGKKTEDKYILTDQEEECKESVVLEPAGEEGDTLYVSFGGMLSQTEGWKSGELAVNALYKMSSASMGYTASVEGEHIRIEDEEKKLSSGKKAELTLVPDEGYSLPAKIQVFMGDAETEASYDAATGKVVLEKVDQDIVIYANGITRAKLPDAEVMKMDEAIWSWEAEKGIQAYEYRFLQEEETVKSGRIEAKDGSIRWNWSEGLEDGEYRMLLKAIGDAISCMNSEEADYQITVNREMLKPVEEEQKDPSPGEQDPADPSGKEDGQERVEPPEKEGEHNPADPSEKEEGQEPTEPSGKGEEQEPVESSVEEGEQEPAELSGEGKGQESVQHPEGKQDTEQEPSRQSVEEKPSSGDKEIEGEYTKS